ncbi:MAG: calcium-binding protein, partial [Brevundimonas sp.]
GGSGNDRLYGSSGSDKLYGSSGNDKLYGSSGSDRISGGTGSDTVSGGDGTDTLSGGDGTDTITGGTGNDVVDGDAGQDVVRGDSGNDVVKGDSGNDKLSGGTGADRVSGGDGADSVAGGSGNDNLAGGAGHDKLYGNEGNDDLDGGSSSDTIDGGDGTNWCVIDSQDARTRCVYDRTAPKVASAAFSEAAVDVSTAAAPVDVTVSLTDDTGLVQVQAYLMSADNMSQPVTIPFMTRVSGTPRDATYRDTISVPRWIPAGTYHLAVDAIDRVGHETWVHLTDTVLRVSDTAVDLAHPTMSSLSSPAKATTVDVRKAAATVPVRVTVSDGVSGVAEVRACASYPVPSELDDASLTYVSDDCATLSLASGSAKAGTYSGGMTIPKGSVGGDWNVRFVVADRAGNSWSYMGPDEWAQSCAEQVGTVNECWASPIPGRGGRFTVLGASDNHAPVLVSNSITPTTVDTLPRAATVEVSARITDVEGVTGASVVLLAPQTGEGWTNGAFASMTLSSGTAQDGIWTGTIELPQGTPPGDYYLQLSVHDLTHQRQYQSPDSYAYGWGLNQPLPGAGKVTVVDSEPPA